MPVGMEQLSVNDDVIGWLSVVRAGYSKNPPRQQVFGTSDPRYHRIMTDRTRAHVFVSGTVQGVYFRATTRDTATEYDVDGWVRNLDDGRVEAVFEGPQEDVETLVEFCHEGSSAANVTDVDVTWEEPQGEDGFEIRY